MQALSQTPEPPAGSVRVRKTWPRNDHVVRADAGTWTFLARTGGPAILVLDLTGWVSPDPPPCLLPDVLDVGDHDDLHLLVSALATAATKTRL